MRAELFYADRRTDGHGEALSQFCEGAQNLICINFSSRWRRRTKVCAHLISVNDRKIWACPTIALEASCLSDYSWIPFSTCFSLDSQRLHVSIARTQLTTTVRRFSYESSRLHAPANSRPIPPLSSLILHSIHVFLPQLKSVCHQSASELFSQIFATAFYFPYHYSFILPA